MLKKDKNNYYLTHHKEINEDLDRVVKFFMERVEQDKILKTANHEKYAKITKKIDQIKKVPETFTLEKILIFSEVDHLGIIESIPRMIAKLELNGFSITGFTPHQAVININKINECIYNIHYYMPKIQEYLICKPEKPNKEVDKILVKNKLYKIIALFRYEHLAAEIRSQIAITPLRLKKSPIVYFIQRFGLTPVTNFIKMSKPKGTIIYLGNGKKQIYYDTLNYLNIDNRYTGLNASFLSSNVFPIEVNSSKATPPVMGGNKIYETFDGIHYRELTSPFPERIKRGPSAMANGYNTLFNKKLSKRTTAPLISVLSFGIMKEFNKQKYIDFKAKANKLPKTQVVNKFIEMLISNVDIGDNKTLKKELHLNIVAERIKLERKFSTSKSIEEFFEDVIADKDNFILKFERKIKIYNARGEKKIIGGSSTKEFD